MHGRMFAESAKKARPWVMLDSRVRAIEIENEMQ